MSIPEGVGAQGEYTEGVQGVLEDGAVSKGILPSSRLQWSNIKGLEEKLTSETP